MHQRPQKIGLMDHMGGGNLGDDTTQTAVMREIRRRWPDAAIHGFSMNPSDTAARHGIPAFPIRCMTWDNPDRNPDSAGEANQRRRKVIPIVARAVETIAYRKPRVVAQECAFLARSFRAMRELDVFVISGGGQLLDSWGGPWAYPYTIFKWVMLARMAGTRCYFVNVGAGPLKHPLSQYFVRHALTIADYVSFRDETSKALARSIGFTGEADVFPDCVYAIDAEAWRSDGNAGANAKVVGMSPMAWCDPRRYWQQNQASYEMFVRKIGTFGADLARSYQIKLFSTDIWFDSQTLQAVDEGLKTATGDNATRLRGPESIHSLDTLLSEMAAMDYVVTCRFHGVIFAHLMNIPVIALSHHPKVATLMADLGLSEYCLDIDDFDVGQLSAAFAHMVANTEEIKARMARKAACYGSALTRQFDHLFQPEFA